MATWDNDETDDRKVASNSKTGNSSEEESVDTDGGYDTDRCGSSGHMNWKDLKSKQAGRQTGRILLDDNMSNDEVGEEEKFDREREKKTRKKSKKNHKTDECKNEIEATNQQTSPRKGTTESPVSPWGDPAGLGNRKNVVINIYLDKVNFNTDQSEFLIADTMNCWAQKN